MVRSHLRREVSKFRPRLVSDPKHVLLECHCFKSRNYILIDFGWRTRQYSNLLSGVPG